MNKFTTTKSIAQNDKMSIIIAKSVDIIKLKYLKYTCKSP